MSRASPVSGGLAAAVAFLAVYLTVAGALFSFHPGLAEVVPPQKKETPGVDGTGNLTGNETGNVTENEAGDETRPDSDPAPRPPEFAPHFLAAGLGFLAGGATYALVQLAARLRRNEGS